MVRWDNGRGAKRSRADQGMSPHWTNPGMGHAGSLGKTVLINAMAGDQVNRASIDGVLYGLRVFKQDVGG